ncbi:MAG: hypothetical protein P8Q37_08575 [Porticoccaceae bacterium]|nr:hypothetical protein [Porticoccaceae bacterium]MDG1474947.1 hypothetical protein [Porticoccaceae bacterium]
MSYILKALNKAERDRRREDPKVLDDFAGPQWDPYQQVKQTSPYLRWIAAAGILSIGVLVGGYILSQRAGPDPAPFISSTDKGFPQSGFIAPKDDTRLDNIEIILPVSEVDMPVALTKVAENTAPPTLVVAGYMYIAPGSASNRLFIGDTSFREQDAIDAVWTLDAILENNFVIRAGDITETIPYP